MKKCLLALVLLFTAIPTANAADKSCSAEKIEEYRKALSNVTLDYSVMPKGSTYEHPVTFETSDVSEKIKIQIQNMTDDFYATISAGEYSEYVDNNVTILDSGVYKMEFYSYECGADPIKSFQILLPFYNSENKDNVWFDGTYTQTASSLKPKKSTFSMRLLIVLILLILIIVSFITTLIIKRRKYKRESQF